MTQQNAHPTPETLDAYAAAGLPDADRDAVASHLSTCPACSAIVADSTELDRRMRQTLSALGPAAGFDDRLAAAARAFATPRPPLRISPPVRRAAIAAAAVLAVGAAGYVGSVGMDPRGKEPLKHLAAYVGGTAAQPITVNSKSDLNLSSADGITQDWNFGGGNSPSTSFSEWERLNAGVPPIGTKNFPHDAAISDLTNKLEVENEKVTKFGNGGGGGGGRSSPPASAVHYDSQDSVLLPNANGDAADRSAGGRVLAKSFVAGGDRDGVSIPQRTELTARVNVDGLIGDQAVAGELRDSNKAELSYGSFATKSIPDSEHQIASALKAFPTPKSTPTVAGQDQGITNGVITSVDREALQSFALGIKNNTPTGAQLSLKQGSGTLQLASEGGGRELLQPYYQNGKIVSPSIPQSGSQTITDARTGNSSTAHRKADKSGDIPVNVIATVSGKDMPGAGSSLGQHPPDQVNIRDTLVEVSEKDTTSIGVGPKVEKGSPSEPAAGNSPAEKSPAVGNGPAAPPPAAVPPVAVADDRKIIRTGSMDFEVDRFDSAQMTIGKIVAEAGGFVGTTESQKLPNGKTRGTITLRVAPERLDGLVLSLRALGDLKSQQIAADDVTKQYTDIQSELSADRAMQDRLLDLIKNGKGTIKDLLAAETELGTWRAKIEKAEGEIRYMNAQIALSTLTITLTERDIQTPAAAYSVEAGDIGIEADDVEKARDSALKAVEDVKGRVIEAELKHLDAGQLQARLLVEVPPEASGATIDRLKMLGRVARLEVQRETVNADGSVMSGNVINSRMNAAVKTETRPTRLAVSIYNLANVAPRRTTAVTLVCDDVEGAYTGAIQAAKEGGGRVVISNLDQGDPVRATATVSFEVSPMKFEAAMSALRHQGEVMKLSATENPDTMQTTDTKQGVTVTIRSLASVMPRESVGLKIAVVDVKSAYAKLLIEAGTDKARVLRAEMNQPDTQSSAGKPSSAEMTGILEFDVPRAQWGQFQQACADAGETIDRGANRSADVENTTDAKIRIGLTLVAGDRLPARESTRIRVEVPDVDKATADAQAMSAAAGGRVVDATVANEHDKGQARVVMDVPLNRGSDVIRQLRQMGTVRGIDASRNSEAPSGAMAHAVVSVEFVTADAIVADTAGPGASIRSGLTTAIKGLMYSLQYIVVGLCLIGPWAVIGWVSWKLWKRRSRKTAAAQI